MTAFHEENRLRTHPESAEGGDSRVGMADGQQAVGMLSGTTLRLGGLCGSEPWSRHVSYTTREVHALAIDVRVIVTSIVTSLCRRGKQHAPRLSSHTVNMNSTWPVEGYLSDITFVWYDDPPCKPSPVV